MIQVNGIVINKVIEIKCNGDTGFNTLISFLIDDRLTGCTDPSDFESLGYKVTTTNYDGEDLDYATIVFPNSDGYRLSFINDN